MKLIFNKAVGKTILKTVVSIAGIISTVDGMVSERRKAKEFEDLKKAVAELQSKIN